MAGTTTNYAFPYPGQSDSPAGGTQIQALADAVDTALDGVDDRLDTAESTISTHTSQIATLTNNDTSSLPQGVIKRGRRTTSTGNVTTTETGVLRVDSIPVYQGRLYKISTSNINIDTSSDNDVARAALRISTSGNATTSDTIIGYLRNTIDNNSQSNVHNIAAFYSPGADGTLSVLLSLVRQAGTGNIIVFGSSTDICDLVIEDLGLDPGNTGVVI